MKHLLVLLLLLCSASVSAQDVIVKKDGSTVVCRIVEVTATEITYKKWSDLNGSNYVMDRSLASAINYENGKKVNLSETTNLYRPNNQNDGTQQYNDRALLEMDAMNAQNNNKNLRKRIIRNTLRWTGGIIFALSGVGAFATIPSATSDEKVSKVVGGLICEGVGVWLIASAISHQKHIREFDPQINSTLYSYDVRLTDSSSLSFSAEMISDHIIGNKTLGLGLYYNF